MKINNSGLRNFHHLYVLLRLLENKNLTLTANELSITPSAVSHILKKQRDEFDDKLMIRVGSDYFLTEKANQLLPILTRTFNDLSEGLQQLEAPKVVPDVVRIGVEDYCEFLFAGKIVSSLKAVNNEVKIEFVPLSEDHIEEDLLSHNMHLYIGVSNADSSYIVRKKITTDTFVTACNPSHPTANDAAIDINSFIAYPHSIVSAPNAGISHVDAALNKLGYSRTIAYSAAHFLSCPFILHNSNFFMTGSQLLLRGLSSFLPLVIRQPPITLPSYDISLCWHLRDGNSGSHRNLRNIVFTSAIDVVSQHILNRHI